MMVYTRITRGLEHTVLDIVNHFLDEDEGATAVEYALMVALIAGAVMGAQQAMGKTVETMYVTAMGLIVGAMGS